MKKLIWFVALTVVIIFFSLVVVNFGTIWKAFTSFPIDRVVAYLLGAASMFVAGLFAGEKIFKSKKKGDK